MKEKGFVAGFNETNQSGSVLWWIPSVFILALVYLWLAGEWVVGKIRGPKYCENCKMKTKLCSCEEKRRFFQQWYGH